MQFVVTVDQARSDVSDLKLTLKPDGEFDASALLQITGWTWNSSALTWTKAFTISTDTIDALLKVNADASDDVTSAACALDVCALASNGTTVLAESRSLSVSLDNNVGRSADGTPSGVPSPDDYIGQRAVRFDASQTLTSLQKAQALANLGIGTTLPTWLADGASDPGSFYPEPAPSGAIATTTQFYFNDVATSGGEGWNSYFLTRIGSAPFLMNLTDSAGHVSTFSVESISDAGDGYVGMNVTFRNGYEGNWSGVYQIGITPAGGGGTVTADTTPTSGFAASDFLTTDGTKVKAFSAGSGVRDAMTVAVNNPLGLVTQDSGGGITAAEFAGITTLGIGTTKDSGSNNGSLYYNNAGVLGAFSPGSNVFSALQQPTNGAYGFLQLDSSGALPFAIPTAKGGLGADNSASSGVPLFAAGTVTMTGTTGTGNVVRAASPSFTGGITMVAGLASVGFQVVYGSDSMTISPAAIRFQPAGGSVGRLESPTLTATRVWTLQDTTGTFVFRDTTDTLTNKTISGATNTLTNLNASNLASGNVPDARNTVSNSTTTTMSALATIGGVSTITGGAGNMTITAGTGASRTLTLQTTTSGSTATTALTISATQVVNIPTTVSASSAITGSLTVGNGTAATNVGIGGGNVNAGNSVTAATSFLLSTTKAWDANQLYSNSGDLVFGAPTGSLIGFRNYADGTIKPFVVKVPGSLGIGASMTLGGAEGVATTATKLTKLVSSIADNTATSVLTVTIPNAAHAAVLEVQLTGRLGAGGAVGADEAVGTVSYKLAIARTAGANAVVTTSSAFGSTSANVAGAATITVTAAASSISGAVGAANTFTVNVTIAKGSGSSTNHTCTVNAEITNSNATGITIA